MYTGSLAFDRPFVIENLHSFSFLSNSHSLNFLLIHELIFPPLEKLTGVVFLQDYGIDFDGDDQSLELFKCKCGSRFCRNMKRTNSQFNLSFESIVCLAFFFTLNINDITFSLFKIIELILKYHMVVVIVGCKGSFIVITCFTLHKLLILLLS